jgi:hypothetical protein
VAEFEASFSAGDPRRTPGRFVAERESESLSFEEMTIEELSQMIDRGKREPAQLDAFFRDLKRFIERGRKTNSKEVHQYLTALKPKVPEAFWRKYKFEDQLRRTR